MSKIQVSIHEILCLQGCQIFIFAELEIKWLQECSCTHRGWSTYCYYGIYENPSNVVVVLLKTYHSLTSTDFKWPLAWTKSNVTPISNVILKRMSHQWYDQACYNFISDKCACNILKFAIHNNSWDFVLHVRSIHAIPLQNQPKIPFLRFWVHDIFAVWPYYLYRYLSLTKTKGVMIDNRT